jgi:hypothetical protein
MTKAKPKPTILAPYVPPPAREPPIFRSAVTGSDGTVDPGYLGLYVVMCTVLGAIPFALLLVAVRMFMVAEHPLDLVGVAAIIGAAGVTFGSAAVGVGVFRRGDQPHPNTQITSAQQTTTTVTQPEAGK